MKTLTRSLAAVVLAAAAAACDGSPTAGSPFVSGNDGNGAAQSPGVLTFTSTQSFAQPTPQTASGGVAGIDFAGSLTTGTPCNTVTATHGTSGNDVTVTVTATSTNVGACAQVVTHNNYTGRVSALLPGTYDFTVLHVNRGTTTTAFTGTVTVQ
jgi:hypothetical protein